MRNYAKNYDAHPRTKPFITKRERGERLDTEWDIRIDLNDVITPQSIRDSIMEDLLGLEYALISGVEVPDVHPLPDATTSKEDHVHIALIFDIPVNRERALRACRDTKLTDEYAVPRNRRYTYAGWLAHHAKSSFKKFDDQPTILFEHGELPEDATDEATCWQVAKILKKFGTKEVKARFKPVYQRLDEFKLAKLIRDNPGTPAVAPEYNL